ncbi:hypothetical protein Tco_0842585 [Tanacetum coccineum]|uniref:Xylulose kinase-1 n=1 Tax=Tanacetum coccineum TaxID=301880 RepID=A0ABQ5B0X3_9ASTR
MSAPKFADSHNMVAFLAKPTESDGFEQILDFLNVNPIKYALTVNPTIYTLCIEQFWATAKVETVNGEVQLQALVYGKKVIITETSVRRNLQLEDAEGIECLPDADIFEQLTLIGYEKPSQKLTFYKAFFSPQWKFLIHTILQYLSAKSTAWNEFSSTMASVIICLATNPKFNFSKYIFESMVKNVESSVEFLMYPRFVQVFLDKQIGDMSTHVEIFVTPSHTKKVFGNLKRVGKGFSRVVTPLFSTMMVQAQEEMGEDEAVNEENVGLSARVVSSKDVGLGEEDASKQERKIHDIDADEDITLENVHDEDMFDKSVFNDEERFGRTGYDGIRLQEEEQEELTIKEKSKLFQQLLEKRRKHFAAKRAEERRNRPTHKKLNKGAVRQKKKAVQKEQEKELESDKSKKQKLDEKVEAEIDDAKEAEELKQCLEIVPDDGDDVIIDATPLSVKIPIVDYKIYQKGKKSFFKIIRADGKTQMYLTFTKLLKNFDREDLEVLWRIVKARFKKTEPVNYMNILLHLNLRPCLNIEC